MALFLFVAIAAKNRRGHLGLPPRGITSEIHLGGKLHDTRIARKSPYLTKGIGSVATWIAEVRSIQKIKRLDADLQSQLLGKLEILE